MSLFFLIGGFVAGIGAGILLMSLMIVAARADDEMVIKFDHEDFE